MIHRPTRRDVLKYGARIAGVSALASMFPSRAKAADPAFTVAIVPDTQFLAGDATCSGATILNALIQWAIDNKQLSVNGTALNIKGFITVGDCQNTANTGTGNANANTQRTRITNAYNLAIAENMFVSFCCGNHDYQDPPSSRSNISYIWREDTGGAWSPTNIAAMYSGGMDLGNGDSASWVEAFSDTPESSANNAIRLQIGSRRILIIALEFFPRSDVMAWAKDLHDQYSDHEVWFTTHGYLTRLNARYARATQFGPNTYSLADAPDSNSGEQMFDGASGHTGITDMARARLVTCGHDIDGFVTTGGSWIWQHTTATGAHDQSVEEIFCNAQGASGTGDLSNFCSSNPATPNGTSSTAHLMLLRIHPTTVEAFMVSTNSGKWVGGSGVTNQDDPVQLFSVPFVALSNPTRCCRTA